MRIAIPSLVLIALLSLGACSKQDAKPIDAAGSSNMGAPAPMGSSSEASGPATSK